VEGMKELTPEEMGWFLYLLNEFELVDMLLESQPLSSSFGYRAFKLAFWLNLKFLLLQQTL
jgi:hypothetical protein